MRVRVTTTFGLPDGVNAEVARNLLADALAAEGRLSVRAAATRALVDTKSGVIGLSLVMEASTWEQVERESTRMTDRAVTIASTQLEGDTAVQLLRAAVTSVELRPA